MVQCTVKRPSRHHFKFPALNPRRRFVVSETLAGRSLAEIGNELGMSRQGAHFHLVAAARAMGLDYGRFRSLADGVMAETREERAAELRERSGRTEFDDPAPRWGGRRDTSAAQYSAELDTLADQFLAGEWTPRLLHRAESLEALLRQGGR